MFQIFAIFYHQFVISFFFFVLVWQFLSEVFEIKIAKDATAIKYRTIDARLFAFAKRLAARGQGRPPACLATINGNLNRTPGPIVLNTRNVGAQVREKSIVSKRAAGSTYEYVPRSILSLIQTERYMRVVF